MTGVLGMQYLIQPVTATYGTVRGMTAALCFRYRFLQKAPIGVSVLGKELEAVTLRCPGRYDTGKVLFAAAFHGQEWLTSLVLLRFLEELCHCLKHGLSMAGVDTRRALSGRTLVFVPMVNPDGVDIAISGSEAAGPFCDFVRELSGDQPGLWQANARGVDINHNFDADFDRKHPLIPSAPAPRRYPGEYPESEPETAAMCHLCRAHDFRHVTALHSQGEEIYWEYGEHTPPQARMMAQILASAADYKAASPAGNAAFGGFKDWFIDTFHRPGFTIELGKGENPLPVSDLIPISRRVRETLLLDGMM